MKKTSVDPETRKILAAFVQHHQQLAEANKKRDKALNDLLSLITRKRDHQGLSLKKLAERTRLDHRRLVNYFYGNSKALSVFEAKTMVKALSTNAHG